MEKVYIFVQLHTADCNQLLRIRIRLNSKVGSESVLNRSGSAHVFASQEAWI